MVSLSSSVHTTGAPRELAEESTRNDSANNTSTQQTKAKQQTTITDFVDSSFASVDRKYPNMAQGSSLVKILAIEAAEERSKSKKEKKSNSPNSDSKDKDKDEEDEDEAYATFTYLAILTALYLPFLLFLWIRRNVFGTASLVRSLFFGHMLRFGVAFLLLPPSTTKTFVPTPVWNFGLKLAHHAEKFWNDKRTQAMIPNWVHVVLSMVLGVQTDNQAIGGGALEKAKKSWPPPGVICFCVFTVLSFVVHPDGVTWIMIGHVQDFIHTSLAEAAEYVDGLRQGTIKMKPSEISGTLATIVIIVTIVNHILSNRKQNNPAPHREKAGKHKHKKGKKGRGRQYHGSSSTNNKDRIRGGHYRSTKDMYVQPRKMSPTPESRSLSPTRRVRSLSDDSTVSTASDSNPHIMDRPRVEETMQRSIGSTQISSTQTQVQQKAQTNSCEESNVPTLTPVQFAEDEKSCASSVATAQTSTTESGGRKKNRRNKGRRGNKSTNSAPSTPQGGVKARLGSNTASSPSSLPNTSEHKIISNSGKERRNGRKSRQHQKETTILRKESSHSTAAIGPKRKQQPANRTRSFTAPEPKTVKRTNSSKNERPLSNIQTMENNSLGFLPIAASQEALRPEPISPLFPLKHDQNRESHQDFRSSTRNECRINNRLQESTTMNNAALYSNPNEISLGNNPALMELSVFLIRIGIIGSAYIDLMGDLASIESFALFTDSDYIKYGIGLAQQTEIISYLENRKLRRTIERNQHGIGWNSTIVRPPPGLGAPTSAPGPIGSGAPRVVSPGLNSGNSSQHLMSYYPTLSTPVPSSYSLTPGSSLNSFSMPLGMPQCNREKSIENLTSHITLPSISPLQQASHPPCHSPGYSFTQKEANDEEIEADLQELGGQMAGSILDF